MAASVPPGGGYEKRDADVRKLAWLLLLLMGGIVLAALLMMLLYGRLAAEMARRQPAPATLAGTRAATPPEPRLANTPFDELRRMRAEEDEALSSYGWVDRSAGIVRLPIDKALDLAAAGGIPESPVSAQGTATTRAVAVLLYNHSKVDLVVWEKPDSVAVQLEPSKVSEVAFHAEQVIDFGMIGHLYNVSERALKTLEQTAASGPQKLQAEKDGRLYLVPRDARFPVVPLPAQPPGFPLVPDKKVDLT